MSTEKPTAEQNKMHRPLTGLEVIDAVLADVRRQLVRSGQFDNFTTWINCSWQGGFKVQGYLRRPLVVKVTGGVGTEAGGEGDEAQSFEVVVERAVGSPESVRRETAEGQKLEIPQADSLAEGDSMASSQQPGSVISYTVACDGGVPREGNLHVEESTTVPTESPRAPQGAETASVNVPAVTTGGAQEVVKR